MSPALQETAAGTSQWVSWSRATASAATASSSSWPRPAARGCWPTIAHSMRQLHRGSRAPAACRLFRPTLNHSP
eukprot:9627854-Lingulodinium_polyedra.AAC.1